MNITTKTEEKQEVVAYMLKGRLIDSVIYTEPQFQLNVSRE